MSTQQKGGAGTAWLGVAACGSAFTIGMFSLVHWVAGGFYLPWVAGAFWCAVVLLPVSVALIIGSAISRSRPVASGVEPLTLAEVRLIAQAPSDGATYDRSPEPVAL